MAAEYEQVQIERVGSRAWLTGQAACDTNPSPSGGDFYGSCGHRAGPSR
ncbi:MAG: hypothetical protein M3502_00270 [Actinomycetota bacterium]|nr:hypothetical protein [Actinomycetota bacterium]